MKKQTIADLAKKRGITDALGLFKALLKENQHIGYTTVLNHFERRTEPLTPYKSVYSTFFGVALESLNFSVKKN